MSIYTQDVLEQRARLLMSIRHSRSIVTRLSGIDTKHVLRRLRELEHTIYGTTDRCVGSLLIRNVLAIEANLLNSLAMEARNGKEETSPVSQACS